MYGYVPVVPKHVPLKSPASYDEDKTYIVTSVLQEPYLMKTSTQSNMQGTTHLDGFCKDLMELIAKQMMIKCKYYSA